MCSAIGWPVALWASLCLSCFAGRAAAADSRPNVIFITVDDQSPLDLRVYNPKSALETPNIDLLAREGMTIDGAYHMGAFVGAVCTPSRHMIMCGRTLWHLPIAPQALESGKCPPELEQQTIPAVFNRAGYATMRTCKPGNSYQAANKLYQVLHQADKRGGTAETGSAWHAEQVLSYLDERAARMDKRPFVIDYGFSHPHDTRDGTPELLVKYGAVNHADKSAPPLENPKSPPLPVNWLPAPPFFYGQPGLRDEVAVSGVWERRDDRTIRNEVGRYFACSENIDIQIGRVLKKLEESGELANTYVIYTSDHGIAIGRHGLQGKQNLYEHSWRVPFIVRGPGIRPGTRAEGNIYLLDLLATICDLTGVQPPETNEGTSFKPVLLGQKSTIRDVLYGCYKGGTKPGMRCVRKGDWKLIKYDLMDGTIRETQLFNLKENPDELLSQHQSPDVVALTGNTPKAGQVNLASDPRYAVKLREMEAVLLAEMRRTEDPWRLWDQPQDGLTPPAEAPARQPRNARRNAAKVEAAN